MTIAATEKKQLQWLGQTNLIYGLVGLLLISQFVALGAWKSFALGWAVAVINFEILKRLGTVILRVFKSDEKPGATFYGLLLGKFAFWGAVIAVFSSVEWMQAIPFVLGMGSILVGGVVLGMRELIYAR